MAKRYDVEIVSAETGEEKSQPFLLQGQVMDLVRKMAVGDSLVINRTEDSQAFEGSTRWTTAI